MKYTMIILVAVLLSAMAIGQFKKGHEAIKADKQSHYAMLVEAGK